MCVASPGTYVYSYGLGHTYSYRLWCIGAVLPPVKGIWCGEQHTFSWVGAQGNGTNKMDQCAGEPRALGHHMDARLRTVTESQQQSATVRLLGRVSHVAPGHPSGEIRLGGGHTVRVSEYVLWVGGGITAS